VVGASAGVGRALSEELARHGYDLVISARDVEDLDALAADLTLAHAVRVTARALDLCGPAESLEGYAVECFDNLRQIDALLIPAGAVADGDNGSGPSALAARLMGTNFLGVATLAGAFVERFEAQGRGTIVLFSSVAAAAPRSRNVTYGAAKAALEYYGRALQHRLAGSGVGVQVYALGYVDTAMAAGHKLLLPPASPQRVARAVVNGIGRGRRFAYLPRYWQAVVLVLRWLPWPIYRRMRF
jgi:short-subunit dehydrogenase